MKRRICGEESVAAADLEMIGGGRSSLWQKSPFTGRFGLPFSMSVVYNRWRLSVNGEVDGFPNEV